jgi:hypothetical protein
MNNWFKIGVPVLIAVLLVLATVGVTLAVSSKGAAGQGTAIEYARGPQCANCAGNGQGSGTGGQDNSTGSVNVPKDATCPSCPGYIAGTGGQPANTNRGGCCGSR